MVRWLLLLLLIYGPGALNAQPVDTARSPLAAKNDSLRRVLAPELHVVGEREIAGVIMRSDVTTVPSSVLERRTGQRLLSEAGRAISSSLEIRRYGGLASATIASFRGLPAEHTIVYRDGIRLTNEQNSLSDLSRVGLDGAERINVLTGISSIMLGGEAVGAALNIVTSPFSPLPMLQFRGATTSYGSSASDEHEISMLASVSPFDAFSTTLSLSRARGDGDYPFFQSADFPRVLRENNQALVEQASLSTRYLTQKIRSSFLATFAHADRGVPGMTTTPGRGASALVRSQEDIDWLAASMFGVDIADSTMLQAAISYQRQLEYYVDPFAYIDEAYDNRMAFAQLQMRSSLVRGLDLVASADVTNATLASNAIRVSVDDSVARRDRLGIHTALRWTGPGTVAVALRVEKLFREQPWQVLPQIAYEAEAPSLRATLHASVGRRYHAPTLNQLYWAKDGRRELEPERGTSWEAGLRLHPLGVDLPEWLMLEAGATFFETFLRDQILWQSTATSQVRPYNIQRVRTSGAEVTISGVIHMGSGFHLNINEQMTFLSAKNLTDENAPRTMPYAPALSQLMTIELLGDDLGSLCYLGRYKGSRYTDPQNDRAKLPPTMVHDITLSTTPFRIFGKPRWSLQLSIQNILDETPYEVPFFPLPGRVFRFSTQLDLQTLLL